MLRTILALGAAAALLPRSSRLEAPAFPKPLVVNVTAVDFGFEAPNSIEAGTVTFRLVNKGKELHHIWLLKLDKGKTMADVEAALKKQGPPPSWISDIGGPNAPVPGGSSEATVTLDPGNYLLLCFIPSADGVPHVMKGMVKPLTVTPSTRGVAEPRADVTLKLSDYGFDLSSPIEAGRQVIRIENGAAQSHEVFIAKLLPGKSAMEMARWAEKQNGPPPGIPFGGATGVQKGRHMYITSTFEPGRYALLCFVPDSKDGKSHIVHGMVREIEVK